MYLDYEQVKRGIFIPIVCELLLGMGLVSQLYLSLASTVSIMQMQGYKGGGWYWCQRRWDGQVAFVNTNEFAYLSQDLLLCLFYCYQIRHRQTSTSSAHNKSSKSRRSHNPLTGYKLQLGWVINWLSDGIQTTTTSLWLYYSIECGWKCGDVQFDCRTVLADDSDASGCL